MRDLDSQIDTMFNETIYHIEADNKRRIKIFTIRFTKSNQKTASNDQQNSTKKVAEKSTEKVT